MHIMAACCTGPRQAAGLHRPPASLYTLHLVARAVEGGGAAGRPGAQVQAQALSSLRTLQVPLPLAWLESTNARPRSIRKYAGPHPSSPAAPHLGVGSLVYDDGGDGDPLQKGVWPVASPRNVIMQESAVQRG